MRPSGETIRLGGEGRTREVGLAATPVEIWAWIGVALMLFLGYVLTTWISGPNFKPTDPGSDPLPDTTRIAGIAAQAVAVLAGCGFVARFLVLPWLRRGAPDTTALLVICWAFMWFWDPVMNYTSAHILYNAHLINFGSWTLGSMPGWISPNGNLLPEPLLVVIPGYPVLCLGSAMATYALLRRFEHSLSKLQMIGIAFLVLSVADAVIEICLIRTGLYVFPGGIRSITLFGGQTIQFPLSEAFFCGLDWTATFILLLYRDRHGLSFVERGVDRLGVTPATQGVLRLAALFGYTHLAILLLWVVPNQWLALHSGPYPEHLPSYLLNNMCAYGLTHDQCPGPGIVIPRAD